MEDIILSRVSKLLEMFVNKSDRTAQNESKQKQPPQYQRLDREYVLCRHDEVYCSNHIWYGMFGRSLTLWHA